MMSPIEALGDELNRSLKAVEATFSRKFRLAAQVVMDDDTILSFWKLPSGEYGFAILGENTPLTSRSLEVRTRAVEYLDQLWVACEVAQDETLLRLQQAIEKARTFAHQHTEFHDG